MNKSITNIAVSTALFSLSVSASAQNQEPRESDTQIERIVVTSDFRAVTLDQLKGSASILSEAQVLARQSQHLDGLLGAIPNVNFASGASRGRFVQIRGIGERSQFSEPLNSSVSFELDNIDLTGLFGLANTFDVQQVEVLRGPQATEFGVGALAGAIRMQSVAPGQDNANRALLSYGIDSTWRAGVAVGHDLNQSAGLRASWIEQRSDGDINNTFLGRDDTNNIDESAGRIAFDIDVNDIKFLVNYRYFDVDNGYDAFSLDNDRNTRSDEPGFDRNETHAGSIRLSGVNSDFHWAATFSASDSELSYGYDEDWTFDGFHPNGYSSFDAYFRDISQQTAEIRLVSEKPVRLLDQSYDWVVGAIVRDRDESLLREYTYAASDFTSEYSPQSLAAYARLDTEFDNQLGLEMGLRVERSELAYSDATGYSEDNTETLIGGKFGLSYPVSSGMTYASISRGYKAGGFNPDERVTSQARVYDAEYNWNYEIGFKQSVLNGDGNIRVALFWMEREDTQVSDFDTLIRDDGSTSFIDVIGNADVGTNKGIEFESQWQLNDAWQLNANLGYLRASFEDYQRADGSMVTKRDSAQAPRYTANLVSTVTFTEHLSWRIELDAKDDHFFSDGHEVRSPSYALLNTSIEWQQEAWTLQIWAHNLTDKDYFVRGFGGFSNDPRDGEFGYETPEPYYQFASGRRIGATLEWLF